MNRDQRLLALHKAARERILLLDGAMGTMQQGYGLSEEDFRGERFKDHGFELRGNNDVLVLTQPDIIRDIHTAYLEADADILETSTFSSTSIAQADYGLEDCAYELNERGAALARQAADAMTAKTPERPRWVAGSIGPTNRTASISPDVTDPGFRNVTFDELRLAYRTAVDGLIDGGSDLLLLETIIDTLNAKAAIFAIEEAFADKGVRLPVMISGTITDLSGRILSGQTTEAFWYSVRHASPFSIGLNCALGAKELRAYVGEMSRLADTWVSVHPNAGLPNEFGGYDETPEDMARTLSDFASEGLVNIVGGCCGTTPDHIRAIGEAVRRFPPRQIPTSETRLRLSGIEPFTAVA